MEKLRQHILDHFFARLAAETYELTVVLSPKTNEPWKRYYNVGNFRTTTFLVNGEEVTITYHDLVKLLFPEEYEKVKYLYEEEIEAPLAFRLLKAFTEWQRASISVSGDHSIEELKHLKEIVASFGLNIESNGIDAPDFSFFSDFENLADFYDLGEVTTVQYNIFEEKKEEGPPALYKKRLVATLSLDLHTRSEPTFRDFFRFARLSLIDSNIWQVYSDEELDLVIGDFCLTSKRPYTTSVIYEKDGIKKGSLHF